MTTTAALWALGALCAVGYWARYSGGTPSALGAVLKTLSTVALAAIGLWAEAPPLITLGLALGSIGDFALTRPGEKPFLIGMLAFALGHLAYALSYLWDFGPPTAPTLAGMVWIAVITAMVISTEVWLIPHTQALRWPVRLYCTIIGAMAIASTLLPPFGAEHILQLGAALFVASDFLLALRMFRMSAPKHQRVMGQALWPLYWGGQALILWGALAL